MRFDWYAATIQAHPVELVEALAQDLGGHPRGTRGMHGYTQGWNIEDGRGDTLARVLAGGRNGDPHAWASGEATEAFCEAIRVRYEGRHHVTRFDAAEDFQAPGTYDLLRDLIRGVTRPRRVKGREIVPEDPEDGRTFYAGAPTSDVRLRLYEKGKQVRGQLPEHLVETVSPDWVRIEAQVRPQKDARHLAAWMPPTQVWGFSDWTQDLAAQALALDVPRVQNRPWREADDDRAFRFMIQQYGPMLARLERELGSWGVVGKTIGSAVEAAGKST